MKDLRKNILRFYDTHVRPLLFRIREWWPFWFYVLNFSPRAKLASRIPVLSTLQQRIRNDLKTTGIAVTSLAELFPEKKLLEELLAYKDALPPVNESERRVKKTFQTRLWKMFPVLDKKDPYLMFSVEKRILDIVNTYMEMWAKLIMYDLAVTHTTPDGAQPIFSQGWHRDPQELHQCKIFIYLNNVDEETGPFTYIPKSVYGKKYGNLFPQDPPAGVYVEDSELFSKIPRGTERTLTGKAGTVVFCDTSGLHRGGHGNKKERIMFTASYNAPSWKEVRCYEYPGDKAGFFQGLSPEATYALTK